MAQATAHRNDHHAERLDDETVAQRFERWGDIDLDQGYEHQERIWTLQRVIWGILALTVEYERFGHRQSQFHPVKLTLTLHEGAFHDGQARVYINRSYLEALQMQMISPMPDSQEPGPDRTVNVFSSQGSGRVTITLQATKMGRHNAEIGLMDGDQPRPPVTFWQLIWP
jgi:hypothetical protein